MTCDVESTDATTAPAATLVPVTAAPTAIPAVDAMPVSVNAPLTPDAVCVVVALKQCVDCINSCFALVQNAVVAI